MSATALRALTDAGLCDALGRVHAAWSAPGSPLRQEAVIALTALTGYAPATLDRSLRHLFTELSGDTLREWVSSVNGGSAPALTAVFAAGNLPGTAVPSVVQALLARSAVFVKSASAEPYLMPAYRDSLIRIAPEIGNAVVTGTWPRSDMAQTEALLGQAEAVIVYGGDAAVSELAARALPGARFIGYGDRMSFSIISRTALTQRHAVRLARKVALDLALFDQQGCLSPQAIYVERGGEISPTGFGELLSRALERLRTLLPRRILTPAEATAIHQFRAAQEFRPARGVRLWQSHSGTAWTVVLAPGPLEPSPLNRTAVLHPVTSVMDVPELAATQAWKLISCGMAVAPRRSPALREALMALGVIRFCPIGAAQFPTAADLRHHQGIDALSLLRGN